MCVILHIVPQLVSVINELVNWFGCIHVNDDSRRVKGLAMPCVSKDSANTHVFIAGSIDIGARHRSHNLVRSCTALFLHYKSFPLLHQG